MSVAIDDRAVNGTGTTFLLEYPESCLLNTNFGSCIQCRFTVKARNNMQVLFFSRIIHFAFLTLCIHSELASSTMNDGNCSNGNWDHFSFIY